jgi:hypothetical protein
MILLQLKKQLEIYEYGVVEHPGYVMTFFLGQVHIKKEGDKFAQQRFNYSLLQRGDHCFMTTSPHLLDTPGEMKVDYIKNHIKLTSVTNDNDHITLIRTYIK